MKKTDIATALGERILDANLGYPIAWANKDFRGAKPFLIFELVPVASRDNTLSGGFTNQTGYVQITVIAELDKFATVADDIGEEVAALFPKALRIPAADGKITIMQPAFIGQGYRDGSNWRVPVRVDYEAS